MNLTGQDNLTPTIWKVELRVLPYSQSQKHRAQPLATSYLTPNKFEDYD